MHVGEGFEPSVVAGLLDERRRCGMTCLTGRRELDQTCPNVTVRKLFDLLWDRPQRPKRGEALLRIAVMQGDMFFDESGEKRPPCGCQASLLNQDFTEVLRFLQHPGVHRPD